MYGSYDDDHSIPVGTPCVVTKDDGEQFYTKVRGPVRTLGHGTKIIFVEGITGGYLLDRVRIGAKNE
jgi:hypothetical protein